MRYHVDILTGPDLPFMVISTELLQQSYQREEYQICETMPASQLLLGNLPCTELYRYFIFYNGDQEHGSPSMGHWVL